MKKIFSAILGLGSLAALSSCNDKLDIGAPYKNITFVYGLLDVSDTAHYVRIQKAFMDENKTAASMAKEPDSNFYASLDVVVREILPGGSIATNIPLSKVDLALEGYPKDTGVFFNTPSYAYKFKHSFNPNNTYRIVIHNAITGETDSATTPIISNLLPVTGFGLTEWLRTNMTINFSRERLEDGSFDKMSFTVNVPPNTGDAELVLRFNWVDSNASTGTITRHSADFNTFAQNGTINPSTSSSQQIIMLTDNRNIYDFLKSSMGKPATANNYRYFDSCDMIVYAAGIEYERYQRFNTNTGGLTGNEIKPLYTNIKGENVMGLFNTRGRAQKLQIPLSSSTLDSLKNGRSMEGYNIL